MYVKVSVTIYMYILGIQAVDCDRPISALW